MEMYWKKNSMELTIEKLVEHGLRPEEVQWIFSESRVIYWYRGFTNHCDYPKEENGTKNINDAVEVLTVNILVTARYHGFIK